MVVREDEVIDMDYIMRASKGKGLFDTRNDNNSGHMTQRKLSQTLVAVINL